MRRLAFRVHHSSALSQLNFGIDRLEFAAGIVDFHLPINASLSSVHVV